MVFYIKKYLILMKLNYFYDLNDNIENYTITQYYSVSGDCYSYNYKEHYESNVGKI